MLHVYIGEPESVVTHPNGGQVAYTSIAFEARIVSGKPTPDKLGFGKKLAWFNVADVDPLPTTPTIGSFNLSAFAGRQQPVHQEPTLRPRSA
jgi:hypothetical protein